MVEFTIWLFNIAIENPLYKKVLIGKPSINGQFSMAMLNNQRVDEMRATNAGHVLAMYTCDQDP